jgi:NACalpha-BTF3-like transcription factor
LIEPWNPYRNLEKKKRLIQLICKIKGEKFDETKEVKNIQIKVEDVSLVMKEILGIDLNITETKDGI